jgi:hypothetical protein
MSPGVRARVISPPRQKRERSSEERSLPSTARPNDLRKPPSVWSHRDTVNMADRATRHGCVHYEFGNTGEMTVNDPDIH